MNLYAGILKKTFLRQFMFRSEVILEIIGNLVRMFIKVNIWTALLASGSHDININEMITYTILSFAVGRFTYTNLANVIAQKAKSGTIAMDLIRPINLKLYLICDDISQHFFSFITSGLVVIAVSCLMWGMQPCSAGTFLLFIISLVLGIWLMYSIDYVMGLLVFWVQNDKYIDFMKSGLMTIFSGSSIPLWFYPDWLLKIANIFPYRLIVFEPLAIYLGKASGSAYSIILLQIAWILVMYVLQKILWRKAQRYVFVQGG